MSLKRTPMTARGAEALRAELKKLKTEWTEWLRSRQLNTTNQREAIVDCFLRSKRHLSIDELLTEVKKKHPRVGYATVYRTLRLLVESGLANSRQFDDGQTRYEVADDIAHHHDHPSRTTRMPIV